MQQADRHAYAKSYFCLNTHSLALRSSKNIGILCNRCSFVYFASISSLSALVFLSAKEMHTVPFLLCIFQFKIRTQFGRKYEPRLNHWTLWCPKCIWIILKKFSSCFTKNTLIPTCNDRLVCAVWGDNRGLIWEPYKIYKYTRRVPSSWI
jgi:hypothetical protein